MIFVQLISFMDNVKILAWGTDGFDGKIMAWQEGEKMKQKPELYWEWPSRGSERHFHQHKKEALEIFNIIHPSSSVKKMHMSG